MKFGFLIILHVFAMPNSNGQILETKDLADKIISAFQTKSFENYRTLLVDSTDFKEILADQIKNNHIPISVQKEYIGKLRLFGDSADIQYRKEFLRLLAKGVKLGIDWTQIKKANFIFEETNPQNSEKSFLTGYLNFSYRDCEYVFFGIQATKLSSGYKISDIRTILEGRIDQWLKPELLDDEDL